MSITTELLPDEPIVLVQVINPFDVHRDVDALVEQLDAIFNAGSEPLVDITDATGLKLTFADLVASLAAITRGTGDILKHPRVARYFIVATNDLIRMGAKALTQIQYGGIPVTVCESQQEAFDLARQTIQSWN